MKKVLKFPKGFEWGAAVSAYQIEGAWNEDGKGESIWDGFVHQPGRILNGNTGDIACDHYHRYKEDVEMMKKIGLKAYRFSISWSRIFPKGFGKPNRKGLDFYKKLIDELLKADIKPMVCLYHFDLPQALQEKGGWVNRNIVEYFEEYAVFIFKELGNSVSKWLTINEPLSIVNGGYIKGKDAPGVKDMKLAIQVMHNVLVSHGRAVKSYRKLGLTGEIGIGLNLFPTYPNREKDIEAAEMADNIRNKWFLDPLMKRYYPEKLMKKFRDNWNEPLIEKGDLKLINTPLDFIGVNYYRRFLVEEDKSDPLGFKRVEPKNAEYDAMGWEIYPQGLYDTLIRLKKEYGNPLLYITEGGVAFDDKLEGNKVHDEKRINYMCEELEKVHEALKDGVRLKGYHVWSLMDNFEWLLGYSKRFGLVYIDNETQKRILKDSAYFYRKIIKDNGMIRQT